ncbi:MULTISPECIES: hypothetical protein [unclassified Streptomyces]
MTATAVVPTVADRLEGAQLPGSAMAVRDSKNPHGPAWAPGSA